MTDGADLPFLQPFVVAHDPVEPVRRAGLHVYLCDGLPAPAVLLVHGGPVAAAITVRPPDWPAYRGYGSLLARAGVVGVTAELPFRTPGDVDRSHAHLVDALAATRALDEVDGSRIVVWAFSGGGVLTGPLLRDSPSWLRGVALTYARCAHRPDGEARIPPPVETIRSSRVPVLLTRPEHEREDIAATQARLVAAAGTAVDLTVIDVAGAHHGFETIDDLDSVRDAVAAGVAWAAGTARRPGPS